MLLADDLSSCFDETLFSSFISRYVNETVSVLNCMNTWYNTSRAKPGAHDKNEREKWESPTQYNCSL